MDAARRDPSPPYLPAGQDGSAGPGRGRSSRRILEAGDAAPDHGMLRPWRFLVVRGEGRRAAGRAVRRLRSPGRPRRLARGDRQAAHGTAAGAGDRGRGGPVRAEPPEDPDRRAGSSRGGRRPEHAPRRARSRASPPNGRPASRPTTRRSRPASASATTTRSSDFSISAAKPPPMMRRQSQGSTAW